MMLGDSDCNYFLYHSLLPSLLLSWSSLDSSSVAEGELLSSGSYIQVRHNRRRGPRSSLLSETAALFPFPSKEDKG